MNKSALSTTVAVILTAIIVGSVVGGVTSYTFSTRSDSTVQELRAGVGAVADAAGIPVDKPEAMKKQMGERKFVEAAKRDGRIGVNSRQDALRLRTLRIQNKD